MNHPHAPDRELQAARTYYSAFGVAIVVVGAFIAIGGRMLLVGAVTMGFGALFAALGTLAPASLCLNVARADDHLQTLMREERDDGEI
jgi:hypothetical protein